jgi:hypothetical protein
MHTRRIKVNVSDVASIIGENPFDPQTKTFEKIAEEHGLIIKSEKPTFPKDIMKNIEPEMKRVNESPFGEKLEKTVNNAKDRIVDIAVKDIVLKESNLPTIINEVVPLSSESKAILEDVKKENTHNGVVDIESVVKKVSSIPKIRDEISRDELVRESFNNIHKAHGTAVEERCINEFEIETGNKVTDRNNGTKSKYYDEHGFFITAQIDGKIKCEDGDTIVETKTLGAQYAKKPTMPKHFVQLRCYMQILGKKKGMIIENFKDGSPKRTTEIESSHSEWKKIESSLILAMKKFNSKYNND